MIGPRSHRGEPPRGRVRLAERVAAPAVDRAVAPQTARMIGSHGDRGEPHRCRQIDETQRSGQERGHLGSRDGLVGAVAPRLAGTACGDAGRGQGVDVGRVEIAFGVGEPGWAGGRQVERPLQECGHLGPVHRPVRAEPGRLGSTAQRHLQGEEPFDKRGPPLVRIHVLEARGNHWSGIGAVEHPHQPYRHLPALERLIGADQSRTALDASEHTPRSQRVQRRLMHAAVIVAEVSPGSFICNRSAWHSCERRPNNSKRHPGPQRRTTEIRCSSHHLLRCAAAANCCTTTLEAWLPEVSGRQL